MNLRQVKYRQPVKDQGEEVRTPSKPGTHLRFYFGLYYQFRSIWRSGPNHTPRMLTAPSLQRKGPSRGTPPLKVPNCRPSLLSKLILAPAPSSYLLTAFSTTFMFDRQDTKTVISTYADTFVLTQPTKSTPHRAGFTVPFLSLRSRGEKSEDTEKRRQRVTLPDRPFERERLRTLPVHLTTACGLWYNMLIYLRKSGLNPAVSKTVAKNRWSTLSKALDRSKLISAALVSSFNPSRTSCTKCKLSWIDFHLFGSLSPLTFKVARFRDIKPTYLTHCRLWSGSRRGWGSRRRASEIRCRAQSWLGRPWTFLRHLVDTAALGNYRNKDNRKRKKLENAGNIPRN